MINTIFEGLRVLELGDHMACSVTGMLYADNGAEVVLVEPPSGATVRSNPAFPMWGRGKKSLVLDYEQEQDRELAWALVETADVVIANFAPGEAQRLGLRHADYCERNPRAITVSITGFGRVQRLERLGMNEAVVTAKSGRSCNNHKLAGSHVGTRAIHVAVPTASCGAAFLAVQGSVSALISRLRTGRGQEVRVSMLDGLSAATMRLAFERQGDRIIPVENRGGSADLVLRCIANCFITPECADGRYLQMCARQARHFNNWIDAMKLSHLREDPRFQDMPLGLKTFEDADELERIIREAMKKRTMIEWIDLFTTAFDVGGDPFLLPEEFLAHPQMVMNERVLTLEDPEKGPVKQVGPLALFEKTPSKIDRPAPPLGANQDDLDQLISTGKPGSDAPGCFEPASSAGGPPLAGITILELAYFLAAPLAATTLAEMGARVIKIEPIAGDPFRTSGLEFVHIVNGKESIGLDLKADAGQEIFRRLVGRSDALLHNFRPGAPDRLKVDYASAAAIKPDIVYQYGASYGSKGPQKHRPAFHSTPNALCGGGILQGGEGNEPIDDSYPDPIAGLGAGAAMAMGIYAKQRYGIGQYIETTMLTSSGYAHSEMLTRYAGAPPMPQVDRGQHGLSPIYRLYEAQGGRYIYLAVENEAQWHRATVAFGKPELAEQWPYQSAAARHSGDNEALAAELASVFSTETPEHWESLLQAAGVSVAAVFDSFERFLADEGFLDRGEHPAFGSFWKLKPRVHFSDGEVGVREPSAIGEHARALLREVGYEPDEIDRLIDCGVVRAYP